MIKKLIYAIAVVVLLLVAYLGWRYHRLKQVESSVPATDNASIVLFYGKTCPHCEVVREYLDKNDVKSKVEFSEREVYGDPSNAKLMMDRQKECSLPNEYVGAVPFLWADGKCYVGQEDIIRFFEEKLGNASDQSSSGSADSQ